MTPSTAAHRSSPTAPIRRRTRRARAGKSSNSLRCRAGPPAPSSRASEPAAPSWASGGACARRTPPCAVNCHAATPGSGARPCSTNSNGRQQPGHAESLAGLERRRGSNRASISSRPSARFRRPAGSSPRSLPPWQGQHSRRSGSRSSCSPRSVFSGRIRRSSGRSRRAVDWHTPAVAGDSIYVGSCNGTFRRLDASGSPIASGGELLVLLADHKADYRARVAVDRALARVVWRQAAAVRSIGGSADLLYVGTPQGTLSAVRAEVPCP